MKMDVVDDGDAQSFARGCTQGYYLDVIRPSSVGVNGPFFAI